MINEQDLRELLGDLESDRVERTISTNDTDKFCEAICAFANDMPANNRPGYLVIGARDADGAIVGVRVTDRLLQQNAPIRLYWFRDHIEIQNAGGLYGAVTPETFPNQNDYRNPKIAEAMKTLGYVNTFGRGIARAQRLLRENGNPPAEFGISEPTFFLATIRQVAS
jgi:predicted HTH transcriptional regulator